MRFRKVKDEITPALKKLTRALGTTRGAHAVGSEARAVIRTRTHAGRSLEGGAFEDYSDRRYYAPVQNRPPGYPAPKGGRRKALRGGRKLRSAVFDGGFREYKRTQGFGARPQLSISDRMLGDIQVQVPNPKRVELFFGSRLSAAKAHGHHYGKRPFFGLRPNETKSLARAYVKYLRKSGGLR